MAGIKKCDRCGTVYEPYTKRVDFGVICSKKYDGFAFTRSGYVYSRDRSADLCPECLDELIKWLNSGDK